MPVLAPYKLLRAGLTMRYLAGVVMDRGGVHEAMVESITHVDPEHLVESV
jgi:hypothetical protein